MAVAWHAVRRGEVGKRTVAVVIGCGPIGLAVILLLKAKGVRTVVASDYSPAPPRAGARLRRGRRPRPRAESPFTAVQRRGQVPDIPAALELAVGTREKLGRLPFGVVARVAARGDARRRAEAPGHLRVRRHARA